jgi:hypothetical protein
MQFRIRRVPLMSCALAIVISCGNQKNSDPSTTDDGGAMQPDPAKTADGGDGSAGAAEAGGPGSPVAECPNFNPQRNPYFGDLHVHTTYSLDAYAVAGTRTTPSDSYFFAKGGTIGVAPIDGYGQPQRYATLERPIDFSAATDHSEFLGETQICSNPDAQGFNSVGCKLYRTGPLVAGLVGLPNVLGKDPERQEFCGKDDQNCLEMARTIWQRTIDAAEQAYDKCQFSSIIAYEWTGFPGGVNLHRNVIFRGNKVPDLPTSYFEANTADELWAALRKDCLDKGNGCDVLAIPHNSNAGQDKMFAAVNADGSPLTKEQAAFRSKIEPLVEVFQHKGGSECAPGPGTPDELCSFELLKAETGKLFPTAFVREALKEGLLTQSTLGANPFKLGFVGATDTHNATPGRTEEYSYEGHFGQLDDTLQKRLVTIEKSPFEWATSNPGSLTVAWAEENTRERIFDAFRRRETYATSGTRPIVRFFGGWDYPQNLCQQSNMVEQGYQLGVPMGSDLPAAPAGKAPTFVISAMRDPGTPTHPGTPLQRVQLIKGWVENGQKLEKVYDVAGDANNGASVDLNTCTAKGAGFDNLCAVWSDPDFDPKQLAFYYVRVLENPTCRWSTRQCLAETIDCSKKIINPLFKKCCDGSLPKTISERAWTSPIWFTP